MQMQHLDLILCAIIPASTIIKLCSFLLLCYSNSFYPRLFTCIDVHTYMCRERTCTNVRVNRDWVHTLNCQSWTQSSECWLDDATKQAANPQSELCWSELCEVRAWRRPILHPPLGWSSLTPTLITLLSSMMWELGESLQKGALFANMFACVLSWQHLDCLHPFSHCLRF